VRRGEKFLTIERHPEQVPLMAYFQQRKIPQAKCFVNVYDSNDTRVVGLIESHNNSKSVSVIVPTARNIQGILDKLQPVYNYRVKCQLSKFFQSEILDQYMKKSRFGDD
jgi:hypothetical protein